MRGRCLLPSTHRVQHRPRRAIAFIRLRQHDGHPALRVDAVAPLHADWAPSTACRRCFAFQFSSSIHVKFVRCAIRSCIGTPHPAVQSSKRRYALEGLDSLSLRSESKCPRGHLLSDIPLRTGRASLFDGLRGRQSPVTDNSW